MLPTSLPRAQFKGIAAAADPITLPRSRHPSEGWDPVHMIADDTASEKVRMKYNALKTIKS